MTEKLIFKIFVALCACGLVTSTSSTVSTTNGDAANKELIAKSLIDSIVDLALEKVKKEVNEPVELQDEITGFKKKILGISIEGELILYNGKLWGVKSIQRSADASFHFLDLTRVNVNCSFSFNLLNFTYDFQTTLLKKISTDGTMNGDISQLVADAGLLVDLRKKTIDLTRLNLTKAKSLKLRINSNTILDKFINFVLKLVMSNFKTIILTQMEKELHALLGQKIHFNFASDE